MRRPASRALRPWAGCVSLLLILLLPAIDAGADPKNSKKKKATKRRTDVSRCVSFDQDDGDRSALFRLANGCTIPVSCGVTWSLRCESAGGKRGERSKGGSAFELEPDAANTVTASADACGNDGWVIDDIAWHCSPSEAK
jgi:hypothetical protein